MFVNELNVNWMNVATLDYGPLMIYYALGMQCGEFWVRFWCKENGENWKFWSGGDNTGSSYILPYDRMVMFLVKLPGTLVGLRSQGFLACSIA